MGGLGWLQGGAPACDHWLMAWPGTATGFLLGVAEALDGPVTRKDSTMRLIGLAHERMHVYEPDRQKQRWQLTSRMLLDSAGQHIQLLSRVG